MNTAPKLPPLDPNACPFADGDAERRERFSEDQRRYIIRTARAARGFSAALYHDCDVTGFERPNPRSPEDERAKLQREFIEAAHLVKSLADRLEKLPAAEAQLRAVK